MRERQARQCKAKNRSGERCSRWARDGQLVCASHGGSSPQALDKALVKATVAKFEYEGHATADPGETLLMLISAWRARAIELAHSIQALADRYEGNLEKAFTSDSWMIDSDGKQVKTGEHVRGLVDLEHRVASQLAVWCAVAIKANLEERRVVVQERNSAEFTDMMRLLINDRYLALDDRQRTEFNAALGRAIERHRGNAA